MSSTLVHLDIEACQIGDRGGKAIATVLAGKCSLRWLDAENNKLANGCANEFAAAILASRSLIYINLSKHSRFHSAFGQDGIGSGRLAYLLSNMQHCPAAADLRSS